MNPKFDYIGQNPRRSTLRSMVVTAYWRSLTMLRADQDSGGAALLPLDKP